MISLDSTFIWILIYILYAIMGVVTAISLKTKIEQIAGRKGIREIHLAMFIAIAWPLFFVFVVVGMVLAIKRKWI